MTVRLCLGLLMPGGPMGPWSSATGALVDGLRSRWGIDVAILCSDSSSKVACRIQYSYCDWCGFKQSDSV